jgi:hypothetical protein
MNWREKLKEKRSKKYDKGVGGGGGKPLSSSKLFGKAWDRRENRGFSAIMVFIH